MATEPPLHLGSPQPVRACLRSSLCRKMPACKNSAPSRRPRRLPRRFPVVCRACQRASAADPRSYGSGNRGPPMCCAQATSSPPLPHAGAGCPSGFPAGMGRGPLGPTSWAKARPHWSAMQPSWGISGRCSSASGRRGVSQWRPGVIFGLNPVLGVAMLVTLLIIAYFSRYSSLVMVSAAFALDVPTPHLPQEAGPRPWC